jgi:heme/copper-type cytochrome/quinol oxidase subunit 2
LVIKKESNRFKPSQPKKRHIKLWESDGVCNLLGVVKVVVVVVIVVVVVVVVFIRVNKFARRLSVTSEKSSPTSGKIF